MREQSLDISSWPLSDLLALRNAVDREVSARGYARTSAALVGEIAERIVADAYAGELANAGAQSVDVLASDGRRIQVKARSLPRGDLRHWAFHDLEFDVAVVLCFDRETTELLWARELSQAEVASLSKPHRSDNWRLRMAAVRDSGVNVTEQLRAAYSALR